MRSSLSTVASASAGRRPSGQPYNGVVGKLSSARLLREQFDDVGDHELLLLRGLAVAGDVDNEIAGED